MKFSLEQILQRIDLWSKTGRKVEFGNKGKQHVVQILQEFIGCEDKQSGKLNEENGKQGGVSQLHMVTDFDCTLTKQRVDPPQRILTSYAIFRECPSIPDSYKKEEIKLYNLYKPIEVDPEMDVETKTAHMVEWYLNANKLLKGLHFPSDELDSLACNVIDTLRDGVVDLFDKMQKANIPVLVFSAGLGDSVVSILKQCHLLSNNVKVISNFLDTDEKGFITGMKGEVIHVFNKNETAIKGTEYYDLIKHKRNVILMGDSLGDANMADGIDHSEAVLKIGFLYDNHEGNLPKYKEHFDIILIDDQTVDIPHDILNMILAN